MHNSWGRNVFFSNYHYKSLTVGSVIKKIYRHQNTNFHKGRNPELPQTDWQPSWTQHFCGISTNIYQWPATYIHVERVLKCPHMSIRRMESGLSIRHAHLPTVVSYTALVTSAPVWDSVQQCGSSALCWFWVNQVKTNNLRTQSYRLSESLRISEGLCCKGRHFLEAQALQWPVWRLIKHTAVIPIISHCIN